jgi:hypothetical protein
VDFAHLEARTLVGVLLLGRVAPARSQGDGGASPGLADTAEAAAELARLFISRSSSCCNELSPGALAGTSPVLGADAPAVSRAALAPSASVVCAAAALEGSKLL